MRTTGKVAPVRGRERETEGECGKGRHKKNEARAEIMVRNVGAVHECE